ncbi:MAG: HEAT repeat domain-containing protein [Candidatus Melainabacteria bacterium]
MTALRVGQTIMHNTSPEIRAREMQLKEIQWIEEAPLQGRTRELRQLTKLWHEARRGHAKSILLSGDAGMGKTALLQAFETIIRKGATGRIVHVDCLTATRRTGDLSAQTLFAAVLGTLVNEAETILEETLRTLNEQLAEHGIHWERGDLMRVADVIRIQDEITPNARRDTEAMMRAIRHTMALDGIPRKGWTQRTDPMTRIVDALLQPWFLIAIHLLNPVHPVICQAFALRDEAEPFSGTEPAGGLAERIRVFSDLLVWMNALLEPGESALLIVLDNWEAINQSGITRRPVLKDWLEGIIRNALDRVGLQGGCRVMYLVSANTLGESHHLGGSLHTVFRNKLLLAALDWEDTKSLYTRHHQISRCTIDETVVAAIYRLSEGNPFWFLRTLAHIHERGLAAGLETVKADFLHQLGIQQPRDILALSMTRLKLSFLDRDDLVSQVIASLLDTYGLRTFRLKQGVQEIATSQQLPAEAVQAVLQQMLDCGFLLAVDVDEDSTLRIESTLSLDYLHTQTLQIQPDIPTEEKLATLKKVIPISLQAGELDSDQIREMLMMAGALEQPELIAFLEETFLTQRDNRNPAVRAAVISGLLMTGSPSAPECVLTAMKDPAEAVRELAVETIGELARRATQPAFHEQAIALLIGAVDDESAGIRAQAYRTMAGYRRMPEVLPVLLKGLNDIDPTVRLMAMKTLAGWPGGLTPMMIQQLITCLQDPQTGIRLEAVRLLAEAADRDLVALFTSALRKEEDPTVRLALVKALAERSDEDARDALNLMLGNPEETEDVRIAVVRALGAQPGWSAEKTLLAWLENTGQPRAAAEGVEPVPPALLWAGIQSLGQVAGTQRSVQLLQDIKMKTIHGGPVHGQTVQDVVLTSVDAALAKIRKRVEQLSELESQLQQATPVAHAIPAEFDEPLPDEDEDPLTTLFGD